MIFVLDASVLVRWLAGPALLPVERVVSALAHAPDRFAVPELFLYETYAALQRVHPRGLDAFTGAVLPLLDGGVARLPFTESLARAADAFVRRGLTGYDAAYAALAQDLGGLWLTLDAKAHNKIADQGVSWCVEQDVPGELKAMNA